MLCGKEPRYDELTVIGSLCYSLDTCHKDKFEKKAKRCILIGYPPYQKAYKLYDLETHTVLVSRDVRFFEYILPFKSTFTQPSSEPSFHTLFFPDHPVAGHIDQEFNIPQHTPSPSHIHETTLTDYATDHIAAAAPEFSNTLGTQDISSSTPPLRRSNRSIKPPAWLKDYAQADVQYPLFSPSDFSHLSDAYVASLFNVLAQPEPSTYEQAQGDPNWEEAMRKEIAALEANDTWEITDLPPGKKAIGSKWCYKIKFNPNGTIEKYKARFVVRGFTQV